MNSQNLLLKLFTYSFRNYTKYFKILLFLSIIISLNTENIQGQNSPWRYVTTVYGGNKAYLNDEMKNLANGNKSVWEKMTMPDGSFAIALAEWDCRNKQRLTKQITFYKSDQTVIGTTKKQFEWSEIIPGSTTDFLFTRICLTQPPPKWAKIITLKANLRSFPDISAPVLRIADQGDKFQIIPETGKGGWYNVVDVETQEDYWLHGNTFEIVETGATK
jgi:hypothetical protein